MIEARSFQLKQMHTLKLFTVFRIYFNYSLVPNRRPLLPPLINFSIFFSTQDILIPTPPFILYY